MQARDALRDAPRSRGPQGREGVPRTARAVLRAPRGPTSDPPAPPALLLLDSPRRVPVPPPGRMGEPHARDDVVELASRHPEKPRGILLDPARAAQRLAHDRPFHGVEVQLLGREARRPARPPRPGDPG